VGPDAGHFILLAAVDMCGATKLNCGIVPLPQKLRKPVRTREFNVGSNGIFFFAPRFDAVELRSSPRLLATAQNTNCQVRLRGLWAMADALCAERVGVQCAPQARGEVVHGVLTCLPTAAAVQDLQRLFYKILNCGLSHENEPPLIPLFNLVTPNSPSRGEAPPLELLGFIPQTIIGCGGHDYSSLPILCHRGGIIHRTRILESKH